MASLVDTNLLIYRWDPRDPRKQSIAEDLLRESVGAGVLYIPHQAIVEFIAAATPPIRGNVILKQTDALRETEELLKQFAVLHPNEAILRQAMRGCAAYQLSWLDAHLWSYAEHFGLSEIWSEDLHQDRLYGTVRVVNPFIGVA